MPPDGPSSNTVPDKPNSKNRNSSKKVSSSDVRGSSIPTTGSINAQGPHKKKKIVYDMDDDPCSSGMQIMLTASDEDERLNKQIAEMLQDAKLDTPQARANAEAFCREKLRVDDQHPVAKALAKARADVHSTTLKKIHDVFTMYKTMAAKDNGERPVHQSFLYRNTLSHRNRYQTQASDGNYKYGEEEPPRVLRGKSHYPRPTPEPFRVKNRRLNKLIDLLNSGSKMTKSSAVINFNDMCADNKGSCLKVSLMQRARLRISMSSVAPRVLSLRGTKYINQTIKTTSRTSSPELVPQRSAAADVIKASTSVQSSSSSDTDMSNSSLPRKKRKNTPTSSFTSRESAPKRKASEAAGLMMKEINTRRQAGVESEEGEKARHNRFLNFGEWNKDLKSLLAKPREGRVDDECVWGVKSLQKHLSRKSLQKLTFINSSSSQSEMLNELEDSLNKFVQPEFPAKINYNLFVGTGKNKYALREQMMSQTTAQERRDKRTKMKNGPLENLLGNRGRSFMLVQVDEPDKCLVCAKRMPNLFSLLLHYKIQHDRLMFQLYMDYSGKEEFLQLQYPEIDVCLNEEFREDSVEVPVRGQQNQHRREKQTPMRIPFERAVRIGTYLERRHAISFRKVFRMNNLLFALPPPGQVIEKLPVNYRDCPQVAHRFTPDEAFLNKHLMRELYDFVDCDRRVLVFGKFWNYFSHRLDLRRYHPNKTYLFLAFKLFFVVNRKMIREHAMSLELLTLYNKYDSDDWMWRLQFDELMHLYSISDDKLEDYLLPVHSLRDSSSPMYKYLLKLGRKKFENLNPENGRPETYSDDFYVLRAFEDRPLDCELRISVSNPCQIFYKTASVPEDVYPPQWLIDSQLPPHVGVNIPRRNTN